MCPECTTSALIETKEHYSCPICGWSGDTPLHKIMDSETSSRISEDTRRLLDLRVRDQLRYVKVWFSDDADSFDVLFEITEVFNVDTIQGDNPARFFVKGEYVKNIKELDSIPGVAKVDVF
jgi:hypothetical protein